jgi:hypothetical protein
MRGGFLTYVYIKKKKIITQLVFFERVKIKETLTWKSVASKHVMPYDFNLNR